MYITSPLIIKENIYYKVSLYNTFKGKIKSTIKHAPEITIEIRRKIGAFDQAHEVSKANDHIAALFELISKCIVLTETEKKELETKKISTPEKKGCMVAVLLTIGSLLGGGVIYAMS